MGPSTCSLTASGAGGAAVRGAHLDGRLQRVALAAGHEGPVDEEQVQVVLLQLLEHLPGRLLHIWAGVVAVVQLRIRTQCRPCYVPCATRWH